MNFTVHIRQNKSWFNVPVGVLKEFLINSAIICQILAREIKQQQIGTISTNYFKFTIRILQQSTSEFFKNSRQKSRWLWLLFSLIKVCSNFSSQLIWIISTSCFTIKFQACGGTSMKIVVYLLFNIQFLKYFYKKISHWFNARSLVPD
jgi:hypothetical protein